MSLLFQDTEVGGIKKLSINCDDEFLKPPTKGVQVVEQKKMLLTAKVFVAQSIFFIVAAIILFMLAYCWKH